MINTKAPWLYHIHPDILSTFTPKDEAVEDRLSCLPQKLNQLLRVIHPNGLQTGIGKPLKFVSQSVLDNLNSKEQSTEQSENNSKTSTQNIATAYETHIANTGEIPTRENLHDLFNAWIWLTFPKTKAMLNRHQSEQIIKDGISGSRGRVRDAITLLDENGAVLITSESNIATALKGFDWQNCLVKPRSNWLDVLSADFDITNMTANVTDRVNQTKASVMLCGHALIEQLVHPRKQLCAHTFILQVDDEFFTQSLERQVQTVDELLYQQVEQWLQQEELSPRQLCPLPIQGIPYFCDDNVDKTFYEDSFVFRSGRRNRNKK